MRVTIMLSLEFQTPSPVSGEVLLSAGQTPQMEGKHSEDARDSIDEYTKRPLPERDVATSASPTASSDASAAVERESKEDLQLIRHIIAKWTTAGGATSDKMLAVLPKPRVIAAIKTLCQMDQLEVDLAANPVRYSLKAPLTSVEAAMSPEPERPMYERWFKARIAKPFEVGFDLRHCTAMFSCSAFQTNNTFGRVIIDFVRSRIRCFRSVDETVPLCEVAI